jgi:hypothetical protein
MKYVLDTNILIEASRRYYAFDLAPKFWCELKTFAESEDVMSIDRVKRELLAGQDELAIWADAEFKDAFKSTQTEPVYKAFSDMVQWTVNQNRYLPKALSDFSMAADGWVVAFALVNNLTVVTHERLDGNQRNRVVIPAVCDAFNVPYIQTFDMLRTLGVIFQ